MYNFAMQTLRRSPVTGNAGGLADIFLKAFIRALS